MAIKLASSPQARGNNHNVDLLLSENDESITYLQRI